MRYCPHCGRDLTTGERPSEPEEGSVPEPAPGGTAITGANFGEAFSRIPAEEIEADESFDDTKASPLYEGDRRDG